MLRALTLLFVVTTGTLVVGFGCTPNAATEGEGEGEGEEKPCGDFVPEPSDACLPICGNEQGVGQPCTKGGGECNDFIGNGAGFCTVDFDGETTLAFCTRPCGDDSDCGVDAVCTGDPDDPTGDKGCIPATCAGEGEGDVAGEGEGEGEGEVAGEGEGEGE